MSDAEPSSSLELEPYETQFQPKENDEEELWEVIEITAEDSKRYKVRWAGVNPTTGKPWPQSWVAKHDCTDALIHEWKVKQAKQKKEVGRRKSGLTVKSRGSDASPKEKKRSNSMSTTATARPTRTTRPSVSTVPSTSKSTRPTSPIIPDQQSPPPRKRRRPASSVYSEELQVPFAGPSRPRKKRKVEVEVVHEEEEPVSESESSYAVANKYGKSAVGRGLQREDHDEEEFLSRPAAPSKKSKGKHKAEEAEHGDEDELPVASSLKIGPPKHVKRKRKQDSDETSRVRNSKVPRLPSHDAGPHANFKTSTGLTNARMKSGAPSLRKGEATPPSHTESSDEDEDAGSVLWKAVKPAKPAKRKATPLSPHARRLLMQEEEENTQEAAGLLPAPAPPPSDVRFNRTAKQLGRTESSRGASPEIHQVEDGPEAGPSRPAILHGRPSANDTFSRDGIVPETQTSRAAVVLDEPPYDPTQDDLVTEIPAPSTPPHTRSEGYPTAPRSVPSVISKMKSKRQGKQKELRPIHRLTPPDFTPYLQSTQDDIEEFSSPEKDSRKKKRTLDPLTQDTIEDADFTVDNYVDWDGGMAPAEPSTSGGGNGPELSLGPQLEPPEDGRASRGVPVSLLSKHNAGQDSHQPPLSPEVPLHEPPPTSTTQRADADSQSQELSLGDPQVVELAAALEEKEDMLTELENEMETLRQRITELEAENVKVRSSSEEGLRALREESVEKSELISMLESQLVEIQLQVTQLSEAENQRAQFEAQISELKETLEERDEQISQLESALIELQTENEVLELKNEELSDAAQRSSSSVDRGASEAERTAARQRIESLEDELATVREKLARAEEDSAALADRLEKTVGERDRQLKYAEDDRELFKKLYTEASTHAQRLARENGELEERAARAEGQAKDGLAMARAMFEKQVGALQVEAERWRGMWKVLADKDARTDDEVRARAAREPELQEENVRLRAEVLDANREVERMKVLLLQMPKAAAKEGGQANVDDEDEDDGEFVPSSDDDSSGSESSSDSGGRSRSSTNSRGAREVSPHSDEEFYVCQHVSGAVMCNARFSSAEDVEEHAIIAHYQPE